MSCALLLLACASEPQPGPALRYVEVAASGDARACRTLDDPQLVAECLVFTLEDTVEAGGVQAGRELCASLPQGVWRSECWFQLSDEVRASGDLAKELCGQAGSFSIQCLGHVVARDSQRILGEVPVGRESEALARLREVSIDYLGQRLGTSKARQNMRKALAARFRDQPFHPDGCGDVGPSMCREVYRELVSFVAAHEGIGPQRGGDKAIRKVCQEGASLELVEAVGLPGWAPEGEELALTAWEELCARKQLLAPRERGKARPQVRPQRGPERR